MIKRQNWKKLYEEATSKLGHLEEDFRYWRSRAEVAEGALNEQEIRLRTSLTEVGNLRGEISDLTAKIPPGSAGTYIDNLTNINAALQAEIVELRQSGKQLPLTQRIRRWLRRHLPIKVGHQRH